MKSHAFGFAFAVVLVLNPCFAYAVVVDARLYHLGEADPGALPLAPGNPTTVDSVGGINANKIGLTAYNGTGGGGPPVGVGIAPGSSMSMTFQNVDSRYQAPAVGGLSDNFGIEAYIQPQTTNDARPFYNGGDGTPLDPLTDGFGLGISGGQYVGLIGGVGSIPTGVLAIPGKPVEMAFVSSGGVFTVYINDVAKGALAVASVPVLATDMLSIGNFDATPVGFAGVVDEARIFTFAPGGFDPKTDLGGAAVPEPSTIALAVFPLAGLGLATLRKKLRRL